MEGGRSIPDVLFPGRLVELTPRGHWQSHAIDGFRSANKENSMMTRRFVLGLVFTLALVVSRAELAQAQTIPAGGYFVVNLNSYKVLDLPLDINAKKSGQPIQQFTFNGGTNQVFDIRLAYASGQYFIKSRYSKLQLEFAPGAGAGTPLRQYYVYNDKYQTWQIKLKGGLYIFKNLANGMVMDVPSGSKHDGVVIQAYPEHGGPNQQFFLLPVQWWGLPIH